MRRRRRLSTSQQASTSQGASTSQRDSSSRRSSTSQRDSSSRSSSTSQEPSTSQGASTSRASTSQSYSSRRTSTSQRASTSQIESTSQSSFDFDGAANECVRWFFVRNASKIPIKRAEIVQCLKGVSNIPSNQITKVIKAAKIKLEEIYDYKLVEVEGKSPTEYIIVSSRELNDNSVRSELVDHAQKRLLSIVLIHLYMSRSSAVSEEEVYDFLKSIDLFVERGEQATKKILTTVFTKQLYLNYKKVPLSDPPRFEFEWGQRAKEELPEISILETLSNALNHPPDHWSDLYRKCIRDQGSQSPMEIVE